PTPASDGKRKRRKQSSGGRFPSPRRFASPSTPRNIRPAYWRSRTLRDNSWTENPGRVQLPYPTTDRSPGCAVRARSTSPPTAAYSETGAGEGKAVRRSRKVRLRREPPARPKRETGRSGVRAGFPAGGSLNNPSEKGSLFGCLGW